MTAQPASSRRFRKGLNVRNVAQSERSARKPSRPQPLQFRRPEHISTASSAQPQLLTQQRFQRQIERLGKPRQRLQRWVARLAFDVRNDGSTDT